MSLTNPPKALLTDVFGTVVDWRSTVTNFLTKTAQDTLNSATTSIPSTIRATASSLDWGEFAWQWRLSYYRFVLSYDPAKGNFKNVDQHHLEALIDLLRTHQLEGIWTGEELQRISMIWHFLDPWSDSSNGLGMLNQKFETCTLSNGNTTLLSDLAKHGSLPYKHIISAEEFKAYKPHPNVYNGAAEKLSLRTDECALIAAHLGDLKGAKKCGYQTIYIERSQEEDWDRSKADRAKEEGWVDMWVSIDEGGFEEVARRFGCTAPRQGVYHEMGSITGTEPHTKPEHPPAESIEEQAKKGIYQEDPSITQ